MIYSKMHPVWCTNTHHDVTSLVNHGMVKYTKTSISREWNIHFLWNKKNLTSLSDGRFWEVIVLEQRQPLINMVTILMMSAKMATSGLLKIKIFWNKSYDAISCQWWYQQDFITWFKLYCSCSHVTKVW